MQVDYLMISGKRDGFGAQLLAKMTGIAYCVVNHLKYLHVPFSVIGDANAPNSTKDLEIFGGMGSGAELYDQAARPIENIRNCKIVEEVVFAIDPDVFFSPLVRELLREKYYSQPKSRPAFFFNDRINVCLHVRRGDVGVSEKNRYTAIEKYVDVISKLQTLRPTYFHVFSNGCSSQLKELNQFKNLEVYLNLDIKKTFHAMVAADVLIPAKSSFSYSAAILGAGEVITDCMNPFYAVDGRQQCRPLKAWRSVLRVN